MGYQSKTYSLSDEVIEELERRVSEMASERGERLASPNRVLTELFWPPKLIIDNRDIGGKPVYFSANPSSLDAIGPKVSDGHGKASIETFKEPINDTTKPKVKGHSFHSGTRPIEGCLECAKMVEKK